MAITFVGQQTSTVAGRTTDWPALTFALTGGSDSTPQAGDLVIIQYLIAAQTGRTPAPAITTSGYTSGTQLGNNGVGFNCYQNYFYKFMGGTPDTTVTLTQTFNVADAGACLIMVFRGVDSTTPIDVTPTTMTGTGTTAGSNKPNPAAITPTTAGAWIIALGAQAVGTAVAFTAPTTGLDSGAFWSAIQADSADAAVGGGYYSAWSSGAHDIDIFNGGVSNANNAQNCYTIALRPASSGGVTATPTLGAVTVTGLAPTSAAAVTAATTLGAVAVAGLAPTVGGGATASPTLGAVSVAGFAPTAAAAATATTTLGAVTIAGFAPTAAAGGNITATPDLGAVTVTGLAPTASAAVTATPTLGAVTIAGFAPTATAGTSSPVTVTPDTGAVTVTGFEPTVSAQSLIRIYADDGGEPIKRKFYERQLAEFEAELAALDEPAPKARKRAVKRAVEALQPIVETVDTAAAKEAAAAILTALRSDLQKQAQRTAAKATIERELARIAKARRKQRDEAALMLLM